MATGTFATATVATGAGGLEIVEYEPVSKIGGASVFAVNPARYATVSSGEELVDDDDEILVDDDDEILTDDGVG